MQRRTFLSLTALSFAGPWAYAGEANWPDAPIRLVVTFPPGGSSDVAARLLAPHVATILGQSVVIDNKPGGASVIGARHVAEAKADGYTLLMSNSAPLSISPTLMQAPPYDPVKSFSHLAYVGAVPTVFAVHPSVPVENFAQLLDWLRSQKGPTPFGSGGSASVAHIVGEQFAKSTGTDLLHVPYKGAGQMRSDLLGGQILFAIDALPQNLPLAKDGRVRLLAVTSKDRVAQAPDLPTVVELGYPQLVADNYVGVSAPAGLPEAIAVRLHQAFTQALAIPEVQEQLQAQGFVLEEQTRAQFAEFVRQQYEAWAPVVRATGATI
ncbi:tripartite tricarboxylate transporter substrate binding protein [Lampropedia puyangensis]|uniref:Tripartite tricarboxylate transporter substrate binding protein n=1 Tax=Lampropedia puyangensis TaxID=1330072 RepID=A0A4S8F0V8_9BURK|nr:tripartite tricarboxylate transporter substrate binding protein [Lampropedia puyangensis]THT99663.1 tripartite tricarboxylate transporter substrate binding protein [Lampropedia puyangensis]